MGSDEALLNRNIGFGVKSVDYRQPPSQLHHQQIKQARVDATTRSPDSLHEDEHQPGMNKEASATYRRQIRDQRNCVRRDDGELEDERELQSFMCTRGGDGATVRAGQDRRPMLSESQERLFEQEQFSPAQSNPVAAGRRTQREQPTSKNDRHAMEENYIKEMELARQKQKRIDEAFQNKNPPQSALSPSVARASNSSPSVFAKMKPHPKPHPRQGLQPLATNFDQNVGSSRQGILSPPPSFSNTQHFDFSFDPREGRKQPVVRERGEGAPCSLTQSTSNQFIEARPMTAPEASRQHSSYYENSAQQKDVKSPLIVQHHQQPFSPQQTPQSAGSQKHQQEMLCRGKNAPAKQPQLSPATRVLSPQQQFAHHRSLSASTSAPDVQHHYNQQQLQLRQQQQQLIHQQQQKQMSGVGVEVNSAAMPRSTSSPQFNDGQDAGSRQVPAYDTNTSASNNILNNNTDAIDNNNIVNAAAAPTAPNAAP